MFRQLLNWRTLLAVIAILIVSGTVWYSSYLADKIEKEERRKVDAWVEASSLLASPNFTGDTRLNLRVINDNTDIPIIWTNERDSIIEFKNLDSAKAVSDSNFVHNRLKDLRSENEPITWVDPLDSSR